MYYIIISTQIKKYPDLIFELLEQKIDNNKVINILIDKINNLEKKVNNLELENNNLKSDNRILIIEIQSLKNNFNNIYEYINQQKIKEMKMKLPFNDSLIVRE